MGLFNTIINTAINTAKELYEADSNDKLGEYAKEKVSNLVKKVDGSEARELQIRKEDLSNSIAEELKRDSFNNDRFQHKVDRYIQEYCSTEDDYAMAYYNKYLGWDKVFNNAWNSVLDGTLPNDERTRAKQDADEANDKCLEALQKLENNLNEDNIQFWYCTLCCARAERLHWMNNHMEATRLAIQGLPYAFNDKEKEWAISLISGKNYDTEHLIRSREGGYGVIIDKTIEESIEFLDQLNKWEINKEYSWEDNDEMLDLCADELMNDIQLTKDRFIFSLQPYHDRQFIFTVRDLDHIGGCYDETDNIKYIFPLDELPKDISFPMGHPQANTLYYAHPLRPVYLPFENAQLTLFYEKVQEMCRLFQCLGATKITARCLKGNKVSSNVMASSAVNAEGGYKIVSGSGGVKNQSNASADSETRDEMFMTQTFSPYKAPYCPKDLVWTKKDPELLSLIKQRMEGGLLDFTKRVSSYETSNMSQNLITDVKAAFQNLMGNVSTNYSASADTTFSSTQETEWEISVEFKPLDELPSVSESMNYSEQDLVMEIDKFAYTGRRGTVALGTLAMDIKAGKQVVVCDEDSEYESVIENIMMFCSILSEGEKNDKAGLFLRGINSSNIRKGMKIYLKHQALQKDKQSQTELITVQENKNEHLCESLSSEEEKYKEEVLFCLEDGGSISDDDRKYLDRKRNKFGISPERAAEIESMCKPQLTEEEQEYLETFREMTSDGEISDRMRRLLDRERESLGISRDRAAEIERTVLKPNV